MVSTMIAPSISRKDKNQDGPNNVPWLVEFGRLVINSICLVCVGIVLFSFLTSTGSSAVRDEAGRDTSSPVVVDDWCSREECQQRLESLRTKLELEEQLYQEQLRLAIASATGCDPDQQDQQCSASQANSGSKERADIDKEDIISDRFYEMFEGDGVASLPQYQPKPEWRLGADGTGGSFPTLNVVGAIKTGTSQLYNIFATHQDVMNLTDYDKEHCATSHHGDDMPEQDLYEYTMFEWHDYYYRQKSVAATSPQLPQNQVNGCLDIPDLERRYAYNPPGNDAKFFYLLRDPADWTWAAYNFFCDRVSEDYELGDNWVNASIHYRSPEAFHEYILSAGKVKGANSLFRLRDSSLWDLRRVRALVGNDNLIVLKNEDLEPHRIQEDRDGNGSTLDFLASRTGLSRTGFDEEVLNSRSNCNANKGFSEKCRENVDRSKGVGYPVTNGRPMLESTRKFIYLQWYETCTIWAEEFGVHYPRCLSVLDEYISVANT